MPVLVRETGPAHQWCGAHTVTVRQRRLCRNRTPGFYQWTQFQYRLDGIRLGDHSNVNVRLYEAGTLKFENRSPDNVDPGYWHYVMPSSPPITRVTSSDWIEFETIFDLARRGDPRCTARTGRA